MQKKKLDELLRQQAASGDPNAKFVLSFTTKYDTPEKRRQYREQAIAKLVRRESK